MSGASQNTIADSRQSNPLLPAVRKLIQDAQEWAEETRNLGGDPGDAKLEVWAQDPRAAGLPQWVDEAVSTLVSGIFFFSSEYR